LLGWLLLAAFACVDVPDDPEYVGDLRALTRARFSLSDAMSPPSDVDGEWQTTELPDRWSHSRPGVRGYGWYRIEFDAPESEGDSAIFVPGFNMNLAIWLNGTFLAECGPFEGANTLCWNFPLQAVLHAGQLRAQGNILDLRLSVIGSEGGLGTVYLGPRALIAHRYASHFLNHIIMPQMFIAMSLTVIVFMLAFWYSSKDTSYLAFAAFVGCLGIMMVNMVLREMPIPLESWRWVTDRAAGFAGPFFIVYVHALAGNRRPRVERSAFAWTLVAAVVTLFLPWRLYDVTAVPLYGVTLMMCGYAIWMLFRALQDSRAMRAAAVSISLVTLGFGFHDALAVMGLVESDHLRLLAFAIPASVLILTAVLTERLLATFRRATNRNIELEERVQQKHLELDANFERMRELEEIRVLASERERIMREMHDGVGGHLVSILAMVEKGRARKSEIAASLRLSIDDMRMVIHSLDPNVDDLNVLLGIFRTRNEQRLRDHGLSARWEIEDLPSVDRLGRTEYLHILRILQEAVTNVARHAKAESIRVRAGVREDDQGRAGIFIEVMDDGIGIGVEPETGRGRVNMAHRARLIGGELRVDSSSEGTRLELWIPIQAES